MGRAHAQMGRIIRMRSIGLLFAVDGGPIGGLYDRTCVLLLRQRSLLPPTPLLRARFLSDVRTLPKYADWLAGFAAALYGRGPYLKADPHPSFFHNRIIGAFTEKSSSSFYTLSFLHAASYKLLTSCRIV